MDLDLVMNNRSINHTIIEFLTELTDNNTITIQQNKHIKLVGLYGGKKRTFMLSCSPSSFYAKHMRSCLKRFLRTLDITEPQFTDFLF
jgi:hypothetical protein